MTAAPKRTVVWRHGTSPTDKPLEPGQHRCNICHRGVSLRKSGVVREHDDKPHGGRRCAGAGVRITSGRTAVRLAELPPVVLPLDRTGGVSQAVPPQPARRPRGMCATCGRSPGINGDGTLRAHRPEADVFGGPYCPGGRPKGKQ